MWQYKSTCDEMRLRLKRHQLRVQTSLPLLLVFLTGREEPTTAFPPQRSRLVQSVHMFEKTLQLPDQHRSRVSTLKSTSLWGRNPRHVKFTEHYRLKSYTDRTSGSVNWHATQLFSGMQSSHGAYCCTTSSEHFNIFTLKPEAWIEFIQQLGP